MSKNISYSEITTQLNGIHPDSLLLDANNPRLVTAFKNLELCPDSEMQGKQGELLEQFKTSKPAGNEDEDFTNIKDLYDSMSEVGFVSIDSVIVRRLEGSDDKYVVVEGNRRIGTVKRLLEENIEKEIEETLTNLDVVLLDPATEENIAAILGLRHFGSVLDWKPIAKAFQAYKSYMSVDPPLSEFVWNPKRSQSVAKMYSVSKASITKSLQVYVVYQQLKEMEPCPTEEHYSLIQAGLPLHKINNFLDLDPMHFTLDPFSIEKFKDLCQFDIRGNKDFKGQIIIQNPKIMGTLKKVLEGTRHKDMQVRERAKELVDQVLEGEVENGMLVLSVDDALNDLITLINSKHWVDEIHDRVDEQEKKLDPKEFDPESNDMTEKRKLETEFRKVVAVVGS